MEAQGSCTSPFYSLMTSEKIAEVRGEAYLHSKAYGEMFLHMRFADRPITTFIHTRVFRYLTEENFKGAQITQIALENLENLQTELQTTNFPQIAEIRDECYPCFTFKETHCLYTLAANYLLGLAKRSKTIKEAFIARQPIDYDKSIRNILELNPNTGTPRDEDGTIAKEEYKVVTANLSVLSVLNNCIYNFGPFRTRLAMMQDFLKARGNFGESLYTLAYLVYLVLKELETPKDLNYDLRYALSEAYICEDLGKWNTVKTVLFNPEHYDEMLKEEESPLYRCFIHLAHFEATSYIPHPDNWLALMNLIVLNWHATLKEAEPIPYLIEFCQQSKDMMFAHLHAALKGFFSYETAECTLKTFRSASPYAPHAQAHSALPTKLGVQGKAQFLYKMWWYGTKRPVYRSAIEWEVSEIFYKNPQATIEENTRELCERFEKLYPDYPNPEIEANSLFFKQWHGARKNERN